MRSRIETPKSKIALQTILDQDGGQNAAAVQSYRARRMLYKLSYYFPGLSMRKSSGATYLVKKDSASYFIP
jgi:hypothetical protein